LSDPLKGRKERPDGRPSWLPPAIIRAGKTGHFRTGETVFRQRERASGLYEVLSGTVRLVRVDAAGRETALYVAGPGHLFAEASLFSPHYHCDAIASSETVVRLFPKAAFLRELRSDPQFAEAFMAKLAREIMNLRTRLEQRNIHSARERVRHYLSLNVGSDGTTVALPGNLKDLAAYLGLTHETLYRTLAGMAADGEIERRKGVIRLAGRSRTPRPL
jgi:CRP-like cAMP-binding protein